ncbi:MAG: hypothetical protein HY870_01170 [Chloroflexi bacterium]|nr:hypothetical protein [Chloroflexota bacterium]
MKSVLRRHALILAFYTVLALIMTWPLIAQLGTHYAGNNEDLWVFQWDNWWTRYALQHGQDILFTPLQFYPVGVSLAAHSLSFYNSFLWIPLAAVFGDIAAYNLTILLTFILSGYTMFLLAEYLVNQGSGTGAQTPQLPITDYRLPITNPRSLIPALLAGLVFAFAPYHFSQSLGHVSLASVQWFPLLALFALKTVREARWRNAVIIGLLIGLITATRLQFLVLGGVVFAIFVAVDWLVARRDWASDLHGRGAIGRLLAAAVFGLILSLPIVLPAAQLFTQADSPDALIADEQTWGQTDLAAYFVPMTYHPVFSRLVRPLYKNFAKNQAWMPFLGYSVLALSIWGAVKARRRSAPWVAIGLFLFVMALGPFLRVNGVAYENIQLPYALIGDTFPLNTLRSPDRYNLLLPLALAVLVAFGANDVLSRLKQPRPQVLLGLFIGALILFEYLGWPYPTIAPLKTSAFHAQLADDPESYAVLDIPLERSDTKYYLYYQTQHQHPLVQGRVARVPPEAFQVFNDIPQLADWRNSMSATQQLDLGAQLARLADYNVRYIILHKNLTAPNLVAIQRDYLSLTPVFEDDQIAVYTTRPVILPQATLGPIDLLNSWLSISGPDQPIQLSIRWAANQLIGRDADLQLSIIDSAHTAVISQTDRLAPATSTWQPQQLVVGGYTLTPTQTLLPGSYTVRVSVLVDGRVIGSADLPHRLINEPARDNGLWLMVVSEEPRVRFNVPIELRAADVSRRGNLLSLWLHWRAHEAPGVNTKYFVHLIDETGQIGVQDDSLHVKYTRPSSTWQADQMISDLIELPLWNLKPGQYRIAVGLADPDTGERLPAFGSDGNPLPDNRYVFTETIQIAPNALTK